MMIRRLLTLVAVLLPASLAWSAEQHTFMRTYDLNTPTIAATTNRIVTSVNLTNTLFTIANQPDVPRNVTITVTDTTPSITAGTITVTGLDVNGATITEVLDLSSALTLTGTKVFASVSSVTSAGAATLGGAGDETIIVGVGSVVGYVYCSTSDPTQGLGKIKTTSSSTTVSAVSGSPFGNLTTGDDITVMVSGVPVTRRITAPPTSTSATVDSAVNWSANGTAGYPFDYEKRSCGTSDASGWLDASEAGGKLLMFDVVALSATGGIDYSIECRGLGDAARPRQLISGNVTSAIIAGNPSTTVAPFVLPEACASIRIGFKFGTVDTSGTDSVSAWLSTEEVR